MELYRVLGASPDASHDELRRAYRARARELHPDVAGAEAEEAMRQLNEAWSVLGDPALRTEYDELFADELVAGPRPLDEERHALAHAPGCARRAPVVAILVVLLAIFVLTAYVAVPSPR